MKTELREIPGVGKVIERDLIDMGFSSIDSLKGEDPQDLYDRHCLLRGYQVDRCMLYVFRCAVYYAENDSHDPEKLKWWYWKDKYHT
ncbi:MAG: helix-hairpin-helix domain-containing protein [bacterium]